MTALVPPVETRLIMAFHRRHHPFNCFYCGVSLVSEPGDPRQITIDHVVAISRGGHVDAIANKVPACYRCNQAKGARSLEDFVRDFARLSVVGRGDVSPTPAAHWSQAVE